jgi:hypothetical protein
VAGHTIHLLPGVLGCLWNIGSLVTPTAVGQHPKNPDGLCSWWQHCCLQYGVVGLDWWASLAPGKDTQQCGIDQHC